MVQFNHRFQVRAELSTVLEFHLRTEGLPMLTPPPTRVELHEAPSKPVDGDRMTFTIWLGPLAIPWTAEFSQVGGEGFTDSQLAGPYHSWVHHHRFRPIDATSTEIEDLISAEIGLSRWTPVALGMWLSLPLLFRHRVRMTRQILERTER